VADVLLLDYTLNGVWTSRILWLIWFIWSIYLMIKNWKYLAVRILSLTALFLTIGVIPLMGILGPSIFFRLTNLDFHKKLDIEKYDVYISSSLFSGPFLILYEDKYIFKRFISTSNEGGEEEWELFLVEADSAKLISEDSNEIAVELISEFDKKIVVFDK